jgi:acetyl-CoA decarbonylase/synthase complex subunit gamma
MALSGIQIYKLLPQTNCKDCGFPTCLAFAMKLAAKQAELAACPHVSEEAKTKLAESAAPPIRLVSVKSNGYEAKAGNEVVLFRHEKTFYNPPGLFVKVGADETAEAIKSKASLVDKYVTNYVGIDLTLDGLAVDGQGASEEAFPAAVCAVREVSKRPLVLMSEDPKVMDAGLKALENEHPLIWAANAENWEAMADLAKAHKAALVVRAATLDEMADLTEKIKAKGVEDLVLDPPGEGMSEALANATILRRLALKKNFRALGYPIISFPENAQEAAQAIAKYSGFVVLDDFAPELAYPLLVLRQNIYTDPQKPIQVQPGLYEINNPTTESPVLVTTNFSITYFSVANEVESSGLPAWLLVTDAEGMSVLTAWAAGKFDSERIAKAVKTFDVGSKISQQRVVLPGHVAVLSGELEGDLPGWEIRVGPREAVDLPKFMKEAL